MDWAHWASIVGRSLAVYLAIVVGLRLGGRREIAQLEPFDFVVILLVPTAVQNAMVGADVTLGGGLVSAATLLGANYVVSIITARSAAARRLVEGSGRPIVENGHVVPASLRREHLTADDVERILQARLDTPTRIEDIQSAVLEVDGSVSVVRRDQSMERSNSRLPSRRVRRRYRPVQ
ncbi:MAG TPA: YetF domain-containing protein [Acidimicrobiia bacterium]|nr:YetF domain-containing protein [Acidimicrobiia bacterium]